MRVYSSAYRRSESAPMKVRLVGRLRHRKVREMERAVQRASFFPPKVIAYVVEWPAVL